MEYLKIIYSSLASIFMLFVSTKIIGNKQMSELNMFDYINGITIGSIAAQMSVETGIDILKPAIAIVVYTFVVIILSVFSRRSIICSRIFSGRSIILMNNGKLYPKNFNRAKLEISEFLTQCRINGFFNLKDIQTAILEQNGNISIMPKAEARPVNLRDLNISPSLEKPVIVIISDGKILCENLKKTGNNNEWLKKQLKIKNIKNIKDVFLATCDNNNIIDIYLKIDDEIKNDFSE